MLNPGKFPCAVVSLVALLLLSCSSAAAETFSHTFNIPGVAQSMAINPATNKIYIPNGIGNNQLAIIDGSTEAVTTVPTGTGPEAVALNPATNKIYVANQFSNNISVVDGATNTVTATIPVGLFPTALAVNAVTNRIYVVNFNANTVSVINGANNTVIATLATGTIPNAIAINPITNKIYVSNVGNIGANSTVTVIDGATNAVSSVSVGQSPGVMAVNPVTNKVYVVNQLSGNITVIDGATNSVKMTVVTGSAPMAVVINPATNRIYVLNIDSPNNYVSAGVSVIDGTNDTKLGNNIPITGHFLKGLTLNATNNKIYVSADESSGGAGDAFVAVIDVVNNNAVTKVNMGNLEAGILAANPVTGKLYDAWVSTITVIDGADNLQLTIGCCAQPMAIAVNPKTGLAYVANSGSANVIVISRTGALTVFSVGSYPQALAVNTETNTIYVANQYDNNVTVINGVNNSVVTTIAVGTAPTAVAINPGLNKIYVANNVGNNVTVIDGNTNTVIGTVTVGSSPRSIAVNLATNKIYVANSGSNNVTVIDGITNSTTSVAAGVSPYDLAVNPVTNKIYVSNMTSGGVTVIDGSSNSATQLTIAGDDLRGIAVNPLTNKIYVAQYSGPNVIVIDGATNTLNPVYGGGAGGFGGPYAVAVNPVSNKVYVGNRLPSSLTIMDGISNSFYVLSVGNNPTALAVDPVANIVYMSNNGYILPVQYVTVLTENASKANPLVTTIQPLPGDQTLSHQPTFGFTVMNSAGLPVRRVLYKLDTWQGPWTVASVGGVAGFSGVAPVLSIGPHVIYAYATDGQDSTASQNFRLTSPSPVIGQIAAYFFTVMPPATATTISSSANPSTIGQFIRLSSTVIGAGGGIPTGTVTFRDGNTFLANATLDVTGIASFLTAALGVGTHSITASYNGDSTFLPSTSPVLVQTVNRAPTAVVLGLAPYSGSNPSEPGAIVTFTAAVGSSYSGTPTGTVTFLDGATSLGLGTANGNGTWNFTTTSLAPGSHPITAVYSGDATYAPSTSSIFSEIIITTGTVSVTTMTVNGSNTSATIYFGVVAGTRGATFNVSVPAATDGDLVVLLEGNKQVGPTLTLNSGQAPYTTNLALGLHQIRATYIGNGTVGGSQSPTVTVQVSPRPKPR